MAIDCEQNAVGAAAAPTREIDRQSRRAAKWGGLALLALPTALLGLDVTLLYLALPALAADLRPSSTQALWIMDTYGFMIAGFLITMGTLGDRVGRRRLLIIGSAAFGLASVLAAFSSSAGMLIAARGILGVAGATLMPSTLALISNMFPGARERSLAIGVWATMFALGMAAGPVVGGFLLERFWWGSAFLVALPVVGVVLIMAPLLLPEYRARESGRLDLFSVVLSLGAILPVIYFVKHSAKAGPSLSALAVLMIGITAAIVFVRRQCRLVNPLLDVTLFRKGAFSAALSILLVGLVTVGGAMLLVTQYLQLVIGLSPVVAGLWMGPPALMMLVAGISAPLLARRIRPGFVMAGVLGLSAVGYLLLALLPFAPGIAAVVVGYSLIYLGLGTIAALGTDLVVSAAPSEKAGSASAVSETVQELGLAVGVATLGSLTTAVYRNLIVERIPANLSADVARAAEDSLWTVTSLAAPVPQALLDQAQAAFVAGLSISATVAMISVIGLAALSVATLRHIPVIADSRS